MTDQPVEPEYEEPEYVDPEPPTAIEVNDAVNRLTDYLGNFMGVNTLHHSERDNQEFTLSAEDVTPSLGEIVVLVDNRIRLTVEVYPTQSSE